jgi:hypothetical protein
LLCTGHSANITITAPAQSKIYTVINASATYTVKIRGATPTTGITIPVSSTATVAWNGSDFVDASGYINGNLKVNGTLTVTGAVTFSTLTSGRVSYTTTAGLQTDSSNFLYNGTNLSVGTTSAAQGLNVGGGLGILNSATLPVSIGNMTLSYESPVNRIYMGDGTGYSFALSKRASSTTTDLVTLTDGGNLSIGQTSTQGARFSVYGGALASGSSGLAISTALTAGRLTSGDTNSATAYIGNFLDLSITELSAGSSPSLTSGIVAFGGTAAVNPNTVKTYTAGTVRTTVDASGNLGIGVTSPSFKLDVAGTQGVFRLQSTTGTNPVYLLTTNTGGDFYFGRENSTGSTFGSNTGYASVLYSAGAYPIVFLPNGTERMRLDSSGNLGLGVTPSAWATSGTIIKALQIGAAGSFAAGTVDPSVHMTQNAYFDGTSWNRISTGSSAGNYYISGNTHNWRIAASGANPISFTNAMTLDASGNLLVGNSTDPIGGNRLLVQSAATANNNRTMSVYNTAATSTTAFANRLMQLSSNASGADVSIHFTDQVANNAYIGMGSGALYFAIGGGTTKNMTLDASGNLGVGAVPSAITRLTVTATSGSLATFTQTSATGYGLTIIPGTDTTYDAFTINNAANSSNQIRMFGDGSAIFKQSVGVGVTSTVYPIHVKKDGQSTGVTSVYTIGRFLNDAQSKGVDLGYNSTNNQATLIAYSGGTASGYEFYAYNGSAWYLPFYSVASTGRFTASYGIYADPSLASSGSTGLQISTSATYNDNSGHVFYINNAAGVIHIRQGGLSSIPFYPNGGAGVAYQMAFMNPQTAVWTTTTFGTITFTENTLSGNTYTIAFNGGNGGATITRTAGSNAYGVYIQFNATS